MKYKEQFFNWSEFAHYSEDEYFQFLSKNLPEDFYVIHSRYINHEDIHYEIDFIVICPGHIYVVEQKCLGDKIIGNDSEWEVYDERTLKTKIVSSPYELIQKKQRLLLTEVKKLYKKDTPKVTSLIIIGSPKSKEIEFDMAGNSKAITYTPEDSLAVFLRHKTFPSKSKYKKMKNIAKTIFDSLKRDLNSLSKIEVNNIVLKDNRGWKFVLKNEFGEIKFIKQEGELRLPFELKLIIDSPSLKTKSFDEAETYLKTALKTHLTTRIKRNRSYQDIVLKTCQSWFDAVRQGKILPNKGLASILKLKVVDDVYNYLAGGFVRTDKDYHPKFKEFRKKQLKPFNERDNFIIIEGPLGCGKTTQLCRIAHDAILNNDRVYLLNSEVTVPDNLEINESIIIVDNFSRLSPQDIQNLGNLADNRKNVVYGALRKELKELVISNYEKVFGIAKLPWRTVKHPKWSYDLQYHVFNELKKDWNCYVVEESIPSILRKSLGNPILLSEHLKFPNRTRGFTSFVEGIFKKKLSVGLPAIYKKYLRLLSDFVELSNETYERILKSVFMFVQTSNFYSEYIWSYFSDKLDLIPISHPIMKAMIPKNFLCRQEYFERWKFLFKLLKPSLQFLFLDWCESGERIKFKRIFDNFNKTVWQEEFGEFRATVKPDTIINNVDRLNIVEKVIFCLLGILDVDVVEKLDPGDFLIDLSKIPKTMGDTAIIQLVLVLMLTNLLEISKRPISILNLIISVFKSVEVDLKNNEEQLLILSLRNTVEWIVSNENNYIEQINQIFHEFKERFDRTLENQTYLNTRNENFPIEYYRIGLHLDNKIAIQVKNTLDAQSLFINFLNGHFEYYWLNKHRKTLKSVQILEKSVDVLLDFLWELQHSFEELNLYKILIETLVDSEDFIGALLICFSALNLVSTESGYLKRDFILLAQQFSHKIDNKLIKQVINLLSALIGISTPEFLHEQNGNLEQLLEIYSSIMDFIQSNKFRAARTLFQSKQNTIKKHDLKLFNDLDLILNTEKNKENSNLEKMHNQVEKYLKHKNYKAVIELTHALPKPEDCIAITGSYLLWRSRGTAFRKTRYYDKALTCYIIALSLTYLDPMGPLLRNHVLGQISLVLDKKNKSALSLLLIIMSARWQYPHLYVQRTGTVNHLPDIDEINLYEGEENKTYLERKLSIYDSAHLLASRLAGSKHIETAKRLAYIALKDSKLEKNKRGQVFSLMLLSRIAYQNNDSRKENEYYTKAYALSKDVDDSDIQKVLNSRKTAFNTIFESKDWQPEVQLDENQETSFEEAQLNSFLNDIEFAVENEIKSQELFEQMMALFVNFNDFGEFIDSLIPYMLMTMQIMPKNRSNVEKILEILNALDIPITKNDMHEVVVEIYWSIILYATIFEVRNKTTLIDKIHPYTSTTNPIFQTAIISIYWVSSNDLNSLSFNWIDKGLIVVFFGEEFIIRIPELTEHVIEILTLMSTENEERFLSLSKELTTKFPNPYLLDNIGTYLYQMQLSYIGKKIIHNAVRIFPENTDLRLSIARILMDKKDYEGSTNHYLEVLKKSEDDLEALSGLTNVYHLDGDFKQGKTYAKQVFDLVEHDDPRYRNAVIILARFYTQDGKLDKSLSLIENAIDKWSKSPTLHAAMSYVAFISEDIEKSKKYCEKAINLAKILVTDLYSKFHITHSQAKEIVENGEDEQVTYLRELDYYELIISTENLIQLIDIGRMEPMVHNAIIMITILLNRIKEFKHSLSD